LIEAAERALADDGRLLFVEPGTRLGGRCISLTRGLALQRCFLPISPCPHDQACPMLDARSTSWCHFSFFPNACSGVPVWLEKLSKAAVLRKRSIALSFLLLARRGEISEAPGEYGRILSDRILLPGRDPGRYACTARGLALVSRAADMNAGDIVELAWPEKAERDAKSGAWLVDRAVPATAKRLHSKGLSKAD